MKINDNGIYRDMTEEEEAELFASQQDIIHEKTPEEQIAELTDCILELAEIIGGGDE